MSEIELKFEEALDRLEEIVNNLESGGLTLEQSLEKFSEGVKLIKFCNQELNKAEKKIEMVLSEEEEFTRVIPYIDEED
ncbi:MAG: exodeoxyribonuclease small subunit [Halanaerobiales bacterium]|nr:exodeoxyribonuclease small subunit [Halanaerobiales bacterium]